MRRRPAVLPPPRPSRITRLLELRDERVVELEAVLGQQRDVRHGGRRVQRDAVQHLGCVERHDAALARLGDADGRRHELGQRAGGGGGTRSRLVVILVARGISGGGHGGSRVIGLIIVVAVGVGVGERLLGDGRCDGRVRDLCRAQRTQLLRRQVCRRRLPHVVGEVVVALAVDLRGRLVSGLGLQGQQPLRLLLTMQSGMRRPRLASSACSQPPNAAGSAIVAESASTGAETSERMRSQTWPSGPKELCTWRRMGGGEGASLRGSPFGPAATRAPRQG